MLETLRNAFKIEDIRKRIGYTFLMLIVIRIGSQLPIPCVNSEVFANWFANQGGDAFSFLDAITGGSFYQMSVFALNITPYITSSIIIQGRKKITKITRYLSVILALVEAIAMAIGFGRSGYLDKFNVINVLLVVTTLTAGSTILMWIGERITERGVGNGISIVLTINIISRIPADLTALFDQFIKGKTIAKGVLAAAIIAAIILVTVVFVVILQDAVRKIPVQYSKKIQKKTGRRSVNIHSAEG